jgi:hypothetical protein
LKDVFAVEHRMFLIIKLKPKFMSKKVVIFNNQAADDHSVNSYNTPDNRFENGHTVKTDQFLDACDFDDGTYNYEAEI